MIPGGGDPPGPKVQILEILYFCQNTRYFSRLRWSTKPNHVNSTMFRYFAPQGNIFLKVDGYNVNFFVSMRSMRQHFFKSVIGTKKKTPDLDSIFLRKTLFFSKVEIKIVSANPFF